MKRTTHITLAALLLLTSCSAPQSKKKKKTDDTADTPKISPETKAIADGVMSVMDEAQDPCMDFYQYACGGWLDATELPGDRARYVRSFDVIREQNLATLRALLEDSEPAYAAGDDRAKARAYYDACMDQDGREAKGLEPLGEELAKLDALRIKDTASLIEHVAELHSSGARPLFSMWTTPDAKNPEVYTARLSQGGLGLPDRSYYLEARHADTLVAYEALIAETFVLFGEEEASAKKIAQLIVMQETNLANFSKPRAELRDPDKTYNKRTLAELEAMSPSIPWSTYFEARGLDPEYVIVSVPEFIEQLDEVFAKVPPNFYATYLKWNVMRSASSALTADFEAKMFEFYGKRLGGQKEQRDQWKRCVRATDRSMGEALGQMYVDSTFSKNAKTTARAMVGTIKDAFEDNLPNIDWMDDATRTVALEKLGTFTDKIGYPDEWRDYSSVPVTPTTYFANARAMARFNIAHRVNRIGQPVDKKEWFMSPPTVNAYYTPFGNQIVFPAGILQAPFFDERFPMAMNYGGIGMVIGHEITHGFDDGGRKFDARGMLRPWWPADVSTRFEERAQCVDDYYSTVEVQPGKTINGKLTLGENIADIGGIRLAHRGYQRWLEQAPETSPIDGMSNDQLFFIAFAQSWCALTAEEEEARRLITDSHSPPKWRINATLSHVPEFHAAFQCGQDTAMHAEKVCKVW